jgi:hypothetical protein
MARYAPNQLVRISDKTFNDIEDWMKAAEISGRNVRYGLNAFAMILARTNQAIAQEMSAGPVDPHGTMDSAAYKIPVRRITGRYYKGWQVKRLAPGVWMLYNASREAYFIEFGINHVGAGHEVTYRDGRTYIKSGRRVRRPIRKLSLIKTMRFVDQSRAGYRVTEAVFGSFRQGRTYQKRGDAIVTEQVQAMPGMRYI